MGDSCPQCGDPALDRCRCPLGDMRCRRGHQWHHCPNCRAVITGASDHAKPMEDHLCLDCRSKQWWELKSYLRGVRA